jgi:hypothetical protein
MIAKSFVETRVSRLAAVSSMSAFENLVFGDTASSGTGTAINTTNTKDTTIEGIERRLGRREHEAVAKILDLFPHSKPPKLLLMLAESDVQAIPEQVSPDKNGEDDEPPETQELSAIARQNNEYYTALWHELEKTPLSDRRYITNLIAEEIRFKNAVWALRLRVYYFLPPEQIKAFLIAIKPGKNRPPLHADALKALEPDIEEEPQWRRWRLWKYLNKPDPGQYWKIDPRFFQTQASLRLYHLARKSLRKNPFTLDTACCFIKLKQFEKEVLTSVVEAVRLGLTGADALKILGLSGKAV